MARRRRNSEGGQYWPLSYYQARHDSFRRLSGAALKVYVELRCGYTVRGDGRTNNNGELTLSFTRAAELLGLSKTTVKRAFDELQDKGFIVKQRQGTWYGRRATEWRVTDLPCSGSPPTREWQHVWKRRKSEGGADG